MKLNVSPLMQAIEQYIAKADNDLKKQLDEEGYVATDVAVEAVGDIEDGISGSVSERVDSILDGMKTFESVKDYLKNNWEEVKDDQELIENLQPIFQEQFTDLVQQFTTKWLAADNPALAVNDERITKPTINFIQTWSEQLAKYMHLSTNDLIEKILLDAEEQKQTIEEVAKIIADSGIREYGYRARRVAVTEVLRMESYSQQEAMIQNPLCYKKKWVHTGEAKVPRPNHVAINGQTVFKGETFTLTGRDGVTYHPMCPRATSLPASESINCHCRLEAISDDNAIGMSKEELADLRKKAMDEVDAEWERENGPKALASRFVNKNDDLYKFSSKIEPIDGFEDIVIHADPDSLMIYGNDGSEISYTAEEFASILLDTPSYHGGAIRLLACQAGEKTDGVAQKLSNALGVKVMAPTEILWVDQDGKIFVSNSDVLAQMWYNGESVKETGEFRTFKPSKTKG